MAWTDDDIAAYLAFCKAIECAEVTVPVTVWANESDNEPDAWDRNGNASGIFQLEPATAKDLGYPIETDPTLVAYRSLSVSAQLGWAAKFYGRYKGQLGSVGRLYVCTFLPALISHGDDMSFVLCASQGPYAYAYRDNRGFDADSKGHIVVADLVAAAERAIGPHTRALLARIAAAQAVIPADRPTQPEILVPITP